MDVLLIQSCHLQVMIVLLILFQFLWHLFLSHDLGLSLRCRIEIVRVEIYALFLILAKRHPVFYSIALAANLGGVDIFYQLEKVFSLICCEFIFLTYTAVESCHFLTSTEMIIYFSLSMYLSSSYWMMYAKNSDDCRSVNFFFISVYFSFVSSLLKQT